jgi:hypothetical protein
MPRGRRRKHTRNTQGLRNQGPGQPAIEVDSDSLSEQEIQKHLPNCLPEILSSASADSEDEDVDWDPRIIHDSLQPIRNDASEHQEEDDDDEESDWEELGSAEGCKQLLIMAENEGDGSLDDEEWLPYEVRNLLDREKKRRKLAGA